MREQQFNYNYYLIRVSNLVRFNYREHCKKIIKILPKLENSIFYYRGVLALFNQNLKVKYHQIRDIDFGKLGLSSTDKEKFVKALDDYVLNKNYEAMNVINHYYNIFLDKMDEITKLHTELKDKNSIYSSIFSKFETRTTETLTASEVEFITNMMNKAKHFTLEDKYLTKLALFWYKSPEFRMSAGSTLSLINFKHKQVPVSYEDISKSATDILMGSISLIDKNYNRSQLDEYFANLKASPCDKKYIIACLINLTTDNIASLKDIILADDFDFTSIDELDTVINTYNYHLFLLSYLNSKLLMAHRELTNNTNAEDKYEVPTNELGEDRNIILSSNDYTSKDKKSYIERDLDDLPEECFSRVRELLTNFKVGNNGGFVIKKLVDIPDTYEIKDSDQIRIAFSKGFGNNYIIKGVFQKKEDTYRDKYVTVSKRPDTFKDANEFSNALEYSKERLEIMLNYLEENARKSNRY